MTAGYRLSVQQRRLWRRACGPARLRLRLGGPLDADRLQAALDALVRRHELLRSTFERAPGRRTPVQVVHPDAPEPPALTADLRALGPGRHALELTLSALAADAESLRLLAEDLAAEYGGRAEESDVLQYSQFAQWQHHLAEEEPDEVARATAVLQRRADPAELRFPLQLAPAYPAGTDPAGSRAPAVVRRALPGGVRAYADRCGVQPDAVLLAAWQVLLWRVTGQSPVTVGTAFRSRSQPDLQGCLGPLTRWLGVPATVERTATFADVVSATARELDEIEEVEEYLLGAYEAGTPRWDAAFACRPAPAPTTAGGVTFAVELAEVPDEPFDIGLECQIGPAGGTAVWRYRDERFTPAYVRGLAEQYDDLLGALVAAGPAVPLSRAIPPRARSGAALHELFEEQTARNPDAVAVTSPGRALTYAELNGRANRLARQLAGQGAGPETLVGVCLEHTADLPAALLAVLKAGGAYVPLDPALPRLRIAELVERAGCRTLLVDAGTAERCAGLAPTVLNLADASADAGVGDAGGADLRRAVDPDQLAYVMFTSGSTGEPKGVLLPHRALVNYLQWAAGAYGGERGTGALVHSSVSFDLTVTSLFAPLLAGRTVALDPAWRDVGALAAELRRRRDLSLLKLTPSHLAVLNGLLAPADLAGTAQALVVGGEALSGAAVRPWRGHARVFNEYGPTEAAVGCCVYEVRADAGDGPVPIGRPVPGTEVLVLDELLRPAPVGVLGEIYIGGEQLARGYLGAPRRTAERFVPHPARPGARLYRTGDLGCLDTDGEIRFHGRRDEQVKVRGVRVEPAEIAATLLRHPAVRDAAVAPGEALAAFLVPGDGGPIPTEAIAAFLRERLPAYMVPERYAWIERIPLTANGKTDQAVLAAHQAAGAALGHGTAAPRDPAEAAVARIFQELLGVEGVGAHDDFFALGGHSMLAVQLIAKLNAEFGRGLPVAVLFPADDLDGGDRPTTVAGLARLARLARGDAAAAPTGRLVLLRAGTGAPVYVLPAAGGDALAFRELTPAWDSPRPLYALQPGVAPSIEALAAAALEEVADGPCTLAGWSMGGLVAFEMARALGPAARLVLLDSYLAAQQTPDDSGDELYRAHARAVAAYDPAPHDVRATLVQAAEQDAGLRAAAVEAWTRACGAPPAVHVLPGGHFSLLRRPHVERLARLLPGL
ncbi:amino acid adenylation domain-containing protein [Dactylosporangium salmoneum]|uniref:Non-ribosomal peptide synthetase n=1 Tax=Dactylosporangium salmoneum TaxID=53361 RepID=A0ABP5TT54_9ACTN